MVTAGKPSGSVFHYLGVDLSDGTARVRPSDVCGLTEVGEGRFRAAFWRWEWSVETLDVLPVLAEVIESRRTFLDGPQALAASGRTARRCEAVLRAPGKTPEVLPEAGARPFAGYIRSSVHLFEALALALSKDGRKKGELLGEVYPGAAWQRLQTGLGRKTTVGGRRERKALVEALGVELPDALQTHDQLDACLAALLAAAADGRVPGLTIEAVGDPLSVDEQGCRREGVIFVPTAAAAVARPAAVAEPSAEPRASRMGRQSFRRCLNWIDGQIDWELSGATPEARAHELFTRLTGRFLNDGVASVCSYAEAIELVFQLPFSRARVREVAQLASGVGGETLANLGRVNLDTFIVSKKSGMPGDGHWKTAAYEKDAWLAIFTSGCAPDSTPKRT